MLLNLSTEFSFTRMNNVKFIKGTCKTMCPRDEFQTRQERNLVKPFEISVLTAVKCYTRSAATQSKCIRDLPTLKQTVKHLLTRIIENSKTPYPPVYDFIFDRLRAVRQDITVQGYFDGNGTLDEKIVVVHILESCIKFYIYSHLRLSAQPETVFSQHINGIHLDECLDHLLALYCNLRNSPAANSIGSKAEFEALNILLSKNITSLYRAWELSLHKEEHIRNALEIRLSILSGNFIRANRFSKKLPLTLAIGYRVRFSFIRPILLEIYERSHRSVAGSQFPLDKLARHLLFDTVDETAKFCGYFGLSLDETGTCVVFKTGTGLFQNNASKIYSTYDCYVREKLQDVGIGKFLYGEGV